MRNKIFSIFFILCFFLIFYTRPGPANNSIAIRTINNNSYISINYLIKMFNFQYSYDIYTEKIRLYRNEHVVLLNVGLSISIIDGFLYKSFNSVIKDRGEIFIPYDLFVAVIDNTSPQILYKRNNSVLTYRIVKPKKAIRQNQYQTTVEGQGEKIKFIVIDAGHGGKDPGAIGHGMKEKVLTLKIARKVGFILKKRLKGIRIIYTRTNDRFIELAARTKKANSYLKKGRNGVFVSIHVNASISRKISGYETYFLSQNPSNEGARNTAALENNVVVLEKKHKKTYKDIEYIEAMMLTTQIQKESSLLANSIQNGMSGVLKVFKSRGVKKADFYVLRGALMPAALVEVGYITHRRELSYLKKQSYQDRVARGVANGIIIFLKKYNKMK